MVFNSLIRDGSIIQIDRKATIRRCAHGRSIGVYRLKPEATEEIIKEDLVKQIVTSPINWIPTRDNPCRHQTKLME